MRTLLLLSLFAFASCQTEVDENISSNIEQASFAIPTVAKKGVFYNTVNKLDAYWHQGLGEINVYKLQQNRYKDIYDGQAVLIFVSEDFLTDKQVKNEQYKSEQSTPIIKTNAIIRFNTGIYDYSLMTSVFTPVNTKRWPTNLKVSNTNQDWCGQAFTQLNWQETGEYKYQSFSYFEQEGDQEEKGTADLLEDELLNRIRMGWEHLPEGEHEMIPSMNFLRLKHEKFGAYKVALSVGDYSGEYFSSKESLKSYTIHYPDFERTLEIVFQAEAPFLIEGWVDSYPSMFDKKMRSTVAVREKTVLRTYWSEHTLEDGTLRAELGLK